MSERKGLVLKDAPIIRAKRLGEEEGDQLFNPGFWLTRENHK